MQAFVAGRLESDYRRSGGRPQIRIASRRRPLWASWLTDCGGMHGRRRKGRRRKLGGAADLRQLDEDAMDALRANIYIWLDDGQGELPGAWRSCRAHFIPMSTSCDDVNNRPIVPSSPMEAMVSWDIGAKHTEALEPM